MTLKYLVGRNTPYPPDKHPEVESKLETVANSFEELWLKEAGTHPLQLLWRRQDALSTNELAWMGDSIEKLLSIDRKWTGRALKIVKQGDQNDRAGAIFEIIALGFFEMNGQKVKPTAADHPGYDAVISRSSEPDIHLSLKSHRSSTHETSVRQEAASIERAFIAFLKAQHITGLSLRVCCDAYPNSQEYWKQLSAGLDAALREGLQSGEPQRVGSFWTIAVHRMDKRFEPLSAQHTTYHVLFMVPHHPNEFANMRDNLAKACANFRKHAKPDQNAVDRILMLRIPPTTSVELCAQWVKSHFEDGDEILTMVLLYQPAIYRQKDTSALSHYIGAILNPKLVSERPKDFRSLNGYPFVGIHLQNPASIALQLSDQQMFVSGAYFYQSGEIFSTYRLEQNKTLTMPLDSVGAGVRRHIELTDGTGSAVIQGKFAMQDDLVLLP